jgi:thioredoxin family protein
MIKVVGISIDDKHPKFTAYVEKHEFPWTFYRVDDEFENPFFRKLDVGGVPRNFLLDASGKVIKEDVDVFRILTWLEKTERTKKQI